MSLYQIIESIASISSTNQKKAIMEANKDNACVKAAFYYTENPRLNYFIKNEDTSIVENTGGRDIVYEDFQIFDKLSSRFVTGNAARDAFIQAISPLNAGSRVIMQRILNRDLRVGAGTTIANKIWKDLIPEYPVMLASKGDKKSMDYLTKTGGPYIVQKKCDGGRVNVCVDANGGVTYRSRSGSTLELYGYFDQQFSKYSGFVFDGELLVRDETGIVDRKTGNGLYTKAVRGTLGKDEVSKMCMEVWDMIPMDQFNKGIGDVPYKTRLTQLLNIVFHPTLVQVVESLEVETLDECVKFYNTMREQGEEGVIIKIASSVWEDRRSKNMVKMKAEETADLLCTGVEEGQGKYKGLIGNLICVTADNELVTGVGTGLTDEDRKRDPSYFISKIVEVGYNEIITAKGKTTKSLFLPVYKQVRFDKLKANTIGELK